MEDLPDAEYQALAEFRLELRRFLQFSEEAAREAGVEPQQHQLLLALRGLPAGVRPTVRELSARLLLKHHSTVELIDRLERGGLVARKRDPDDARAVLVALTPRGRVLLKKLSVAHRQQLLAHAPELQRALDDLGPRIRVTE